MPNQPHATSARRMAGTFAPAVPNAARQYTGNGIPNFVPACALRIIGISTMTFARKIVSTACHQFMPPLMSDDASMYVGMHADMEIHSAAKLNMPHLRRACATGARSALNSRLCSMSASTSGAFAVRPDEWGFMRKKRLNRRCTQMHADEIFGARLCRRPAAAHQLI